MYKIQFIEPKKVFKYQNDFLRHMYALNISKDHKINRI